MIIYYQKNKENTYTILFSIDNVVDFVEPKYIPAKFKPCFLKEYSYIVMEDSELPKPVGYYELDADNNEFKDKETGEKIKPKIIKEKNRDKEKLNKGANNES